MTQNDGSGSCSSCRRSVVVYTTDSTGAGIAACTHNAAVVFIICGGYHIHGFITILGTLLHVIDDETKLLSGNAVSNAVSSCTDSVSKTATGKVFPQTNWLKIFHIILNQ